jgi:DNA repair exonuclease SbcCD nuclease subunit
MKAKMHNNKVLIFADIHLHRHKGSIERLYDGIKVFNWVCQTARQFGIKSILFSGDLLQDRQKIETITYQKTFEVFEKNRDLNFWLLVGNHDMWYSEKWDVNSLMPFGVMPHVTVVSSPCTIEIEGKLFDWLPYVKNPKQAIEKYFPSDRSNRILIAHLGISGAKMSAFGYRHFDSSVEFDGDVPKIDSSFLSEWERVFLGHYHMAQEIGDNAEYVGSPLQLNFNETGQEKHIIVYDLIKQSRQYVINDFSPKHLIVNQNQLADVDFFGNYVRIESDTESVLTSHENLKDARDVTFRPMVKEDPDVLIEDKNYFFTGTGGFLERYLDTIGCGPLDKNSLLAEGESICESITSE